MCGLLLLMRLLCVLWVVGVARLGVVAVLVVGVRGGTVKRDQRETIIAKALLDYVVCVGCWDCCCRAGSMGISKTVSENTDYAQA